MSKSWFLPCAIELWIIVNFFVLGWRWHYLITGWPWDTALRSTGSSSWRTQPGSPSLSLPDWYVTFAGLHMYKNKSQYTQVHDQPCECQTWNARVLISVILKDRQTSRFHWNNSYWKLMTPRDSETAVSLLLCSAANQAQILTIRHQKINEYHYASQYKSSTLRWSSS